MIIDAITGRIVWNPGREHLGAHPVTVRVEGGREGADEQMFTLAVEANEPPAITSAPVITAVEDQPYRYDVDAQDPNTSDVLTFSLPIAPTGMTIDAVTGLIQWTPTSAQVGSQSVTVRVQDAGGLAATQSFTITVQPANRPPVLTSTPVLTAALEQPYSYDVEATDPDPDETLIFSLPTAPNGMTINAATGVIQWTQTATQVGPHEVTVRVQDAGGLAAAQHFTVVVVQPNRPPTIISTPPTAPIIVGQLYRYDVDATDPDVGDVLTFSLAGAPTGMTIDAATGLMQWTPTADQVGLHTFVVRVQDSGGLSALQEVVVTVQRANQPPVITSTPLTTTAAEQPYSYDVEATDPDAGETLTFSLRTALPGMTIDATTGLLQWTPTTTHIGDHEVTVQTQDAGGLSTTQSFTVMVTASPQVCVPPPPGIVGWWPGDGNAEDIVDSNPGTPEHGVTFTAGQVGQTFHFAKPDDLVFVPDNANLSFGERQDFTIEAWINLQHLLPNADDWIVHKGDGGQTAQGFTLHAYSLSVRRVWLDRHPLPRRGRQAALRALDTQHRSRPLLQCSSACGPVDPCGRCPAGQRRADVYQWRPQYWESLHPGRAQRVVYYH
jgi:hypothetical protein